MKHSTLFIDESGKSSLAVKENEPFILTGVILDDSEITTIEGFFKYIKLKLGISTDRPFHSYDILEAEASRLSDAKLIKLVKSLAEYVSLIPIKVMVLSIDKDEFKQALGVTSNDDFKGSSERKEMPEYPYRIMSSKLFSWFANYLNKNNHIGGIVADSRKGGDSQLIKSLDMCKDKNGPLKNEEVVMIKNRCNAISFADKSFLSGGLEITDLISYTSFFNARKTMSSMESIQLNKIWKQIRPKLNGHKIERIYASEIKKFFKITKNGVHKNLIDR